MKCKLCKINNLDNVGSHIFTESIIRTAFNQEGYLKRCDKEIIFESSTTHLGLEHTGRSILPERIEELQELTNMNSEYIEKPNPFINRDLVCRCCEDKFGTIENAFIDRIYKKVIENTNVKENYISFENAFLLSLQFVIINIWRASASNYDNFKLNEIDEEYLRKYIFDTSNEDLKSNLTKSQESKSKIENFHFAIIIFQQNTSDLTENGVVIENYDNSYFILLNRFSIIFDFKRINWQKLPNLISGIMEKNVKNILENTTENSIRIGICSDQQSKTLASRIYQKQFDQLANNLNNYFKTYYFETYKSKPNQTACDEYSKSMYEYVLKLNGNFGNISTLYKNVQQIVIKLVPNSP